MSAESNVADLIIKFNLLQAENQKLKEQFLALHVTSEKLINENVDLKEQVECSNITEKNMAGRHDILMSKIPAMTREIAFLKGEIASLKNEAIVAYKKGEMHALQECISRIDAHILMNQVRGERK